MRSISKTIIIGHLGRDPESKQLQDGKQVCSFSLAVSEGKDVTQWFNVEVWDKLAEICKTYLRKGSKVYVEGRIRSKKYTDKNQVEREYWYITAEQIQMLDGKVDDTTNTRQKYIAPVSQQQEDFENDLPF